MIHGPRIRDGPVVPSAASANGRPLKGWANLNNIRCMYPAPISLPDWTLPGVAHREVAPCAGREPRCVGALRGSHVPVHLRRGHDRLSSRTFWGAGWLQGPGTLAEFLRRPQRLDPDGWLARPRTDAEPIESPTARVTSPGEPHNPSRPSPNARGSVLPPLCPLDKRLLMGGTIRWRHLLVPFPI